MAGLRTKADFAATVIAGLVPATPIMWHGGAV